MFILKKNYTKYLLSQMEIHVSVRDQKIGLIALLKIILKFLLRLNMSIISNDMSIPHLILKYVCHRRILFVIQIHSIDGG